MNTPPLEALAWATTVLALSLAGLAYLYTTRRDTRELRVHRESLLGSIEVELRAMDPWRTGWRPEWVQNPPPQWLDPFYAVLAFPPYDAISEGALRGSELRFQSALVEALAELKQIAHTSDKFSGLQRQLVFGQPALAIGIKQKQVVELGPTGGVNAITWREPLRPDEEVFLKEHLGLHAQLVRGGLSPLENALVRVREGVAGERGQDEGIAFILGKLRPVAVVIGYCVAGIVGLVGLIYTFVYLCEVSRPAFFFAGSTLTDAANLGRSLLKRRP